MTDKSYVIRGYHFGYNDECYYVNGAYNHGIYSNKDEAEAEYRRMEVKAALELDLDEVGSLFDNEKLADQAKKFLLTHGGCWDDGGISSAMSDDSVLAFLDLIDWHSYKLIEFEGKPRFYGLWWVDDECYECESDEEGTYVTFEPAANDFIHLVSEKLGKKTLKGTLGDLSQTPHLLQALIESDPKITFDSNSCKLVISRNDGTSWIALAELLKKPPFELRLLSLE